MTRVQRFGFACIGLALVLAVTTATYGGQSLTAVVIAGVGVFLVAVG